MKEKSFTGPFWAMLSIAIISGVSYYTAGRRIVHIGHVPPSSFLLLFLWPLLLFIETAIYWMLRKRIAYPKYAWAHISSILFGLIIFPLIRVLPVLLSRTVSARAMTHFSDGDYWTKVIVFWASVILGHVFFTMLLITSLRPVIPKEDPENTNLLDDVFY